MKTKLLTLFAALCCVCVVYASNVITYTARTKLRETTNTYSKGLHTDAFNKAIKSHTFDDGQGTITFTGEVTSIGDYAFRGCSGLISVTIPNSVTSIGNYAFQDCSGLITIPNSVTSIGDYAFDGCSGLTSVNIPNSVTSIGNHAFASCTLTSITVDSENTVYDSRNDCNAIIETITNKMILGCKSTIIPNSVTEIGESAFIRCSGLTSVSIGNSVTSIGDSAFYGCRGLTSVTIPNSVTSIGDYTFLGCRGLTSVTIPNSVTSIGDYTFDGCDGLTSVTIPNSVTSIGERVFYGCSGLTAVNIPNSVTSIGYEAFYGCSGLTSLTIPNSVTSIGYHAFAECSGLRTVTCLAPQVPTAGDNSFIDIGQEATLYVLADLVDEYKNAVGWYVFKNILPLELGANIVPIASDELKIEPTATTAAFTWPTVVSAVSYELVIKKDGVVFCTLTFNESGQLTGLSFAPSKADKVQGTSGFQFTVTGLDEACLYSYNFDAKDSGGNVLKNYNGTFSTDGYVGVKQVTIPGLYAENGRIVCENAQDMRIYTLTGVDVTSENGHLQGIYIVKCGEQTQKVVVR